MEEKQRIADMINAFIRASDLANLPDWIAGSVMVTADDVVEICADGSVRLRRTIPAMDVEIEVKVGASSMAMLQMILGMTT